MQALEAFPKPRSVDTHKLSVYFSLSSFCYVFLNLTVPLCTGKLMAQPPKAC